MRELIKFLRLDGTERLLLLKTFARVWIASVILRLLPFAVIQRLFASRTTRNGPRQGRHPIGRILWAIDVANRYVPGTSCLSLAVAGRTMLNREGYPAQIHIGVAKDHGCSLAAHAWVESGGKILIGGNDSTSLFAPLAVIGEGTPL
jgi:hypothetical protein